MTGEKPQEWVKWSHLAEWCYNTSYHNSIKASPYEAIYGKGPRMHILARVEVPNLMCWKGVY